MTRQTPHRTRDLQTIRVVIENITPTVDCGRYAVKRIVGERIGVEADIYKDGHDLIGARIRYRLQNQNRWRTAELNYRHDPDRWFGAFTVDQAGLWEFVIEAWPDQFASWRRDLEKRKAAGQDINSELLEGAVLLSQARPTAGLTADELADVATLLGDTTVPVELRYQRVMATDVGEAMHGPLDPNETTRSTPVLRIRADRPLARFGAWYELFPRSQSPQPDQHGTFADTARRLPELAALGFDVIYLPPIHPIGRSKRKGRNNAPIAASGDPGSPWAIGSAEGGHTAVHPDLGTLEDFRALVEQTRSHGMEIALDYALQCSPDHPWAVEHPEWFFLRPDGTIHYAENPPKKYEDIYPLNFWCPDHMALWEACADILLYWIEQGVHVFRVDNPHTKPLAFWEWCIAKVQSRHPEVIFLSESFTRPKRMRGLAKLGFSQSYTYFTWKNTAQELTEYLSELTAIDSVDCYRPNFFANTPDILHEHLQRGGRPAFRSRLILAATLSPSYGIYSGYELCENVPVRPGSEEYFNSEKYQIRQRDWHAPGNILDDIAAINRIRRENPALQRLDNLEFLPSDNEQILCYRKHDDDNDLIITVNLDPHQPQETTVWLPLDAMGIDNEQPFTVDDLLSGESYVWQGKGNYVRLDPEVRPAHILRLTTTNTETGT